jgi:tetratricopeptide (TPR) repeat protein
VALTELRQPAKAYQHAQRALAHMRNTNDPKALAQGFCDLSSACLPVNKYGEAILNINEAIRILASSGDAEGEAHAQILLGGILIDQKRYVDAIPTLLKAYRYVASEGDVIDKCWAERDLARTYAGLGRWKDAEHFLVLAEGRASQLKAVREFPSLLGVRIRLHEARGEQAEALQCAKHLIALNDSLIQREVAGRIATMSAMHDADEQQEELEQQRAKNDSLRVDLEDWRTRGRWWIAGLLLLVATAVACAHQFRFNRRAVRHVREKNQRIRELNEEVQARNMDLERQRIRLTQTLMNEEQKDLLLKEIHHRVKNNLQVVNTLLKMEALHLNDPALEHIFNEAQGRVQSMALVHEHIYRVGDLNRVNVKAHVLALAEGILANHGLRERVKLDVQVTYDKASVETLIPLSLLLNELLTNSAKHAFEGRTAGMIKIILRRMASDRCELLYVDDGAGLCPEHFGSGTSFGLELIRTLALQLNGQIRLLQGEGTTFELSFGPEEPRLRAAS